MNFIIGEDRAVDLSVLMEVVFVYKEPGIYGLRFGITEVYDADPFQPTGMAYDIETSKKYVPKRHRAEVLNLVLAATEILADMTAARKITMQSYHKAIPEKGMRKYSKVCDTLGKCGLALRDYFYSGTRERHYWFFERND